MKIGVLGITTWWWDRAPPTTTTREHGWPNRAVESAPLRMPRRLR